MSWQGHVRNVLFHFASCEPLNKVTDYSNSLQLRYFIDYETEYLGNCVILSQKHFVDFTNQMKVQIVMFDINIKSFTL